jgi:hypothetical protein
MGVKEEYHKLKERWVHSEGSQRDEVQKELDAFFERLSDGEKALVNEAVSEDLMRIHKEIDEAHELKQRIEVRKIMDETLPFISVSEFARTYFGKSASWLHQRINGNAVHGKTATFTKEELNTLANALNDVAGKLTDAALKVAS